MAAKAFALNVPKAGNGSGTVTPSPVGISCGGNCQASFDSGTGVSLTATPASGSLFTGWSGDCTGAGAGAGSSRWTNPAR